MSTPEQNTNLDEEETSTATVEELEFILVSTRNLRERQNQVWGPPSGMDISFGSQSNASTDPSSSQRENVMQLTQAQDSDGTDDTHFSFPGTDTSMSEGLDDDTTRTTWISGNRASAEDDTSRSSSPNTSTRSADDPGAAKDEYLGYFTQARRAAMMRQMQEDMGRYDARRERDFGLGARDPRALTQLRIPKRDRPDSAQGRDSTRNVRRRRNAIVPAGPIVGRSRLRDPSRLRQLKNPEDTHQDLGVPPRPTDPLRVNSADYTYRFLEYLHAGGTPSQESPPPSGTGDIFTDHHARFSLLNEISDLHPEDDEIGTYLVTSDTLALVFQTILRIAVYDGLNRREATAFINEWTCFIRNWGDIVPYVPGSLHPRYMMFWAALRRGWAHWIPSRRCRKEIRYILRRKTRICHQFPLANDQPLTWDVRRNFRRSVIYQSGLPEPELHRLDPLFHDEQSSLNRMTLVFENWTAISEHVEAGRLPSEASFTSQELRMDRLERLIREERLVNDGMERVDEEADVEDDEDDDLYFAGVHRDEDLSSEVDENEDGEYSYLASDDDDSVDDDERFADADEDEDVTFVRGPNSTRWA